MVATGKKALAVLGALALVPAAAFAQEAKLVGDAYFFTGSPNNFGSTVLVSVGGPNAFQGLWQFDLTNLPAGTVASQVSAATLHLFISRIGSPGSIDVFAASGSWAEATVNGASSPPSAGTTVASNITVGTPGIYLNIPVTGQVQAWLNGAPNNGFLLKANAGAPTTLVSFDSKESATTSHPATLEIILTNPAGAAGPTGPQGATGAPGATGPTGPSPMGATGPTGASGITGPSGAAGVGATGQTGPTGSPGVTGQAGPQGPPGPSGPNGPTGTSGPIGGAGLTGFNGPTGPTGSPGPTGLSGAAGANGATGLTGPSGPSGATGGTGPAGLSGPVGFPGPTGPQGPQGATGNQGIQGVTGPQGTITNAFTVSFFTTPAYNTTFYTYNSANPVPPGGTSGLGGASAVIADADTHHFFVVTNACPGPSSAACFTDNQSNPGVGITLPHANVAGKKITLMINDFSFAGAFLCIFPQGSDKIVSEQFIIGSGSSTGFRYLEEAIFTTLISDGNGLWHRME